MKVARLHVYLLLIIYSTGLHAQISSTQPQNDSIRLTLEDSTLIMSNETSQVILPSTYSDTFTTPTYMFKPTPKKAVIYSAIFPGLGQIYNRQYWKLPILYGGFVGFTYAITWNNC